MERRLAIARWLVGWGAECHGKQAPNPPHIRTFSSQGRPMELSLPHRTGHCPAWMRSAAGSAHLRCRRPPGPRHFSVICRAGRCEDLKYYANHPRQGRQTQIPEAPSCPRADRFVGARGEGSRVFSVAPFCCVATMIIIPGYLFPSMHGSISTRKITKKNFTRCLFP
jgi:hypothetical protein